MQDNNNLQTRGDDMNTRKADQLIKAGKVVEFYDTWTKETFEGVPITRDRYNLWINYFHNSEWQEGVFERSDLIVNPPSTDPRSK